MKSDLYSIKEVKEMPDKKAENLFLKLYHKEKKGPIHHPGGNSVKKPTLSQRMDRLEVLIASLVKEMRNGFSELRQDVKDINARLDYIVDANNLKDRK